MITKTIKTQNIDSVLELLKNIGLAEVTIRIQAPNITPSQIADESLLWLNADLSGKLPPYEWGKEGPPQGKAVRYKPDKGFVIIDETP